MGLFSRTKKETVALIDVGARIIEAALVSYVTHESPLVVYSVALPIVVNENEPHETAMLRALESVVATLHDQGTAALVRTLGSATIASALISLDSPWQETNIHTEAISYGKPFTVTKKIVRGVIEKLTQAGSGIRYTDVSVVGSVLNGYEVHSPYGKKALTAAIIVLTSRMGEDLYGRVQGAALRIGRGLHVAVIAGPSLRYQALRMLFPHEDEALFVDVTGPLPEVALLRKGYLVALSETPESLSAGTEARAEDLMRGFADIGKAFPLPHTMFLLSRADRLDAFVSMLSTLRFDAFWIAENPPRIIPLVAATMKGAVRVATSEQPDLPVLLMALYYHYLERRP